MFHTTLFDIILYIRKSKNQPLLWYTRKRRIYNTLNNLELLSSVYFMMRGGGGWGRLGWGRGWRCCKYELLMEVHVCFMNPEFLIDCVGTLWIWAGVVRYLWNIRTQPSVEYFLNELILEHVYICIYIYILFYMYIRARHWLGDLVILKSEWWKESQLL